MYPGEVQKVFLRKLRQVIEPILESQGLNWSTWNTGAKPRAGSCGVPGPRRGGDAGGLHRREPEVGAVLEVKDPDPNAYVSRSPPRGLTRPAQEAQDFDKFRNQLVKDQVFEPRTAQELQGNLLGLEENKVRVKVDQQVFELTLERIAKANLEIDF